MIKIAAPFLILCAIHTTAFCQENNPTKKQTIDWILSKLNQYQIPLYEDYKEGNFTKTIRKSDFTFNFQSDLFIAEYTVSKDYGKKVYKMRAEIPISEIEYIQYTGEFTTMLVFYIKNGDMIYVINENDSTKTLASSVKIGFWVRNQADYDIADRLNNAFAHLQELLTPKKKEPF